MKATLMSILTTLVTFAASANTEIPLWPNGAPGALGKDAKDIPTLTIYEATAPAQQPVAAMIVCPGGGYGGLAEHEGSHYAKWLNEQGIAAFVLKYRLGSAGYRHPAMLQDAARAIRTVRARAREWNVDTNRVGIIGSSAGGHLASTLLTHFNFAENKPTDSSDPIDALSCRPDLGVVCYPVITMDGPSTHSGSRKNLLGENPSPELVRELSNQLHVTKDTPPTFIWHTAEDKGVLVENSLMFAEAFAKAKVPFELHIYEKGAHGLGLGSRTYDRMHWHRWTSDCNAFLMQHDFATRWIPGTPIMPKPPQMKEPSLRAIPERGIRGQVPRPPHSEGGIIVAPAPDAPPAATPQPPANP
jgi:acetyl esterase/lipase